MTRDEGSSINGDKPVKIPDEFAFPYAKPYDIQLNFMKSLYKTLELEKIGIFESPTGTVRVDFGVELNNSSRITCLTF